MTKPQQEILLSARDASAVTVLGGKVEPYDPTLHCDNKCLRAGRCLGASCHEFKLIEWPTLEGFRK